MIEEFTVLAKNIFGGGHWFTYDEQNAEYHLVTQGGEAIALIGKNEQDNEWYAMVWETDMSEYNDTGRTGQWLDLGVAYDTPHDAIVGISEYYPLPA